MSNRNANLIGKVLRHAPNMQAVYTNPADKFYYTPASVRLMGMWVCSGCGAYNMEHEWSCLTCQDDKHMLRLEMRDMIERNNGGNPSVPPVDVDTMQEAANTLVIRTNHDQMDLDFIFQADQEHPYLLRPANRNWNIKLNQHIDYVVLSRRGILRRFAFINAHKVTHEGETMYRINLMNL